VHRSSLPLTVEPVFNDVLKFLVTFKVLSTEPFFEMQGKEVVTRYKVRNVQWVVKKFPTKILNFHLGLAVWGRALSWRRIIPDDSLIQVVNFGSHVLVYWAFNRLGNSSVGALMRSDRSFWSVFISLHTGPTTPLFVTNIC